ncbi:ATP-binding protein [Herpetosiphon gulosus]|uniref:Schlafen AlbA-2 domain-containing protein n=1 Tax=Herpetosiphon gulosus TaxID=1973496 RepID=A0ABP9X876_9CHLR
MIHEPHKQIEGWTEEDLLRLPSEENDHYEYKSSQIPMDRLKEKISIAASAFWNSGGGFFIVGIDDTGHIDGGIAKTVGRQKLPDWIDQILLGLNCKFPQKLPLQYI